MKKIDYPGYAGRVALHNHSTYSDGINSIEDMCIAAKEAGLEVFGISDHWYVPADETIDSPAWRMRVDKLDSYVKEVLELKKKYDCENFSLKLGLEVDYLPENVETVMAFLQQYPFDYFIGSVHFSGKFPIDHDKSDWVDLSEERKDEICNIYWDKVKGAAADGRFLFLGHLDLPKKFAVIDNDKYFDRAVEVLDILQKNGGAMELNTAGMFKECAEVYPSMNILKEANQRRISVIVNADAHDKAHVTRYFSEAADILRAAGYDF